MRHILVFGLLLAVPILAHAAANRTLTTDISTAGINSLAIAVGVGELRVTPSSDDAVHVRVTLQPKSSGFLWFFHWQSTATSKDIQTAQITQHRDGDHLTLSLSTSGKLNSSDVKQTWDVQIPVRLALNITMKVGQVTVTGIAGGVHTDLNVGEIDLDTPGGPLSVTVNVGQISAVSASKQLGPIELSSSIGEAALFMDGKHVREGGRHSGLGRRIHLPGSGPDSMKLSVNVGEVDLRINSPQPPQNKS
ncbi:MAG: hypothetical protein ACRESE_06430 [Gammaproteobacteria bacterium]